MRARIGAAVLEVMLADLTRQHVDAIVTAANRMLSGGDQAGFGGGVDGAIHRAAGAPLLEACRTIGGCAPGNAVATHAGALEAKRVIHAVGPVFGAHAGEEDALLASAHRRALEVADAERCESVAFPAISCGVYHFPLDRAAPIALRAIRDHLVGRPTAVKVVRYCLFTPTELSAFEQALVRLAADDPRVVLLT